jgi:hypothetical protein
MSVSLLEGNFEARVRVVNGWQAQTRTTPAAKISAPRQSPSLPSLKGMHTEL